MGDYLSNNGSPGTPYIPGQFYDATRGLTKSQFESPSGASKAVPYEDGFLSDPSALHRSIGVVNLSGKDISVVCDRDKRINKTLPAARENEKEINGFFLPHGEASHFNIPPWCYHVTVSEFVESENGGKKWLTRQGFEMAAIQNQVITFNEGEAEGTVTDATATGHLGHFAWVNNYTNNRLQVTITKATTAYAQSSAQIQESKVSRAPDRGGDIVERREICAGGQWHFRIPPRLYTIRALEPPSTEDGADQIMGQDSRVPDVSDYVLLAESNAVAGQIVVFLAAGSRNGCIQAKTYNSAELKLVESTIVQTSRVGYD
jgi:hypothetical protein